MGRNCGNCNSWQPTSNKPLEVKGFCYKETILPEPKKRTDSCGDWKEWDGGVLINA